MCTVGLDKKKDLVQMLNFCFYTVGLKAADRTEVQNEWMQGKVLVIVATISFGMGVDKANVRWDGFLPFGLMSLPYIIHAIFRLFVFADL